MTAIGNAIYAVAVALGIAQLVALAFLVAAMALTAKRRRRPKCALCLREFGPRELSTTRRRGSATMLDVHYCEPCAIARCEAHAIYASEKRRGGI